MAAAQRKQAVQMDAPEATKKPRNDPDRLKAFADRFNLILNTLLLPIGIGAIIALVLGLIILLVARFFTVEIDEAEEALTALMPGANCGGGGYSGCCGYAASIASNR